MDIKFDKINWEKINSEIKPNYTQTDEKDLIAKYRNQEYNQYFMFICSKAIHEKENKKPTLGKESIANSIFLYTAILADNHKELNLKPETDDDILKLADSSYKAIYILNQNELPTFTF